VSITLSTFFFDEFKVFEEAGEVGLEVHFPPSENSADPHESTSFFGKTSRSRLELFRNLSGRGDGLPRHLRYRS